jgi:predicted GTPase
MNNYDAKIITIDDIHYLRIVDSGALYNYNICKEYINTCIMKGTVVGELTTNSYSISGNNCITRGKLDTISLSELKLYLENAENKNVTNLLAKDKKTNTSMNVKDADIIVDSGKKYIHNKANNALYLYTNCVDFVNRYRGINMNRSGGRVIMSDGHLFGSKVVSDRVKSPLDLNTCKELLEIVNNRLLVEEQCELSIQEAVRKILVERGISTKDQLDAWCDGSRTTLYDAVKKLAPQHWLTHNTPESTIRALYESLLLGYKCVDISKHHGLIKDINEYNVNNDIPLHYEVKDGKVFINSNNNSASSNDSSSSISIPQENINICIVGTVSAGKSTILNAFFCEQLSQCKIKRTTMVPTVYIENANSWNPFDTAEQTEQIFKTISEKNQEIITLTENGHKLKKEEYSELVFNVGKLDINILPDSFVNVYDIPGLNDARTKDVYYEYLDDNFHKFNLVIFLVDIHSGLNTSDEMEIVNFITNRTKDQLENNNRKIYTLVVVNKADDMQLNEEDMENDTDKLELTGELSEMYDQVEKTLTDEFKRKNVSEHLIGIIPMCAIDAYLYRMVKKHGQGFKLSPEQILKIGVNENGKKFSTLKPKDQEKKVYEILNDKTFIDTMIKLSGFSSLEKVLAKFLSENDKGKQIRIDNLLYDLRQLPKIKKVGYHQLWLVGATDIKNLVKQYCDIYSKIKEIDIDMYKEHMVEMLTEILTILKVKITGQNLKERDICELLAKFNNFKTIIIDNYFNEFEDIINDEFYLNGYPLYLVKHIITGISDKFNTEKNNIAKIISMFDIIDNIGSLNKEIVEQLLNQLITNNYERHSINFEEFTDMNLFVELLTKFQSLDIDLTRFLRFTLINRHISSLSGFDKYEKLLWSKMLSYQKRGEVAISNWIRCTGSTLHFNIGLDEIDIFINWKPNDGLDELDLFYLNYIN